MVRSRGGQGSCCSCCRDWDSVVVTRAVGVRVRVRVPVHQSGMQSSELHRLGNGSLYLLPPDVRVSIISAGMVSRDLGDRSSHCQCMERNRTAERRERESPAQVSSRYSEKLPPMKEGD